MVSARAQHFRNEKQLNRNRARGMRHEATDAEKKFWLAVRDRRLDGHKFKRQVLVANYIIDFVCLERFLIVELDGGQHSAKRDAKRNTALASRGFRILRFWNNEVLNNMDGVLSKVSMELGAGAPSP